MSTETRNERGLRLGGVPGRVVKLPKELAGEVGARGREAWLAGLGALAAAGEQGAALYQQVVKQGETLVERGERVEERGKARLGELKDNARARRAAAAEKVESAVVDPVADALARLGVPTREEIRTVSARVESLTERVNLLIATLGAEPVAEPATAEVTIIVPG